MTGYRYTGHALTTTMLIMVLFAMISLSTLRNALLEDRMAGSHRDQLLLEDRAGSALEYIESTVIPDIFSTSLLSNEPELGEISVVVPLNELLPADDQPNTLANPIAVVRTVVTTSSLTHGQGYGEGGSELPMVEILLSVPGHAGSAGIERIARYKGFTDRR